MAPKAKLTSPPSHPIPAKRFIESLTPIAALRELIATLRGDGGCPWDRQQTPESVTTYLLEEAYELVSAVEAGEHSAIEEELGDVLFQVLFMAQLFEEHGLLDLAAVAERNRTKMMRRHPHVFGDETIASAGDVKLRWAEIKAVEKETNGQSRQSIDIPTKLPALLKVCRYFERLPEKPHPSEPLGEAVAALNKVAAATNVSKSHATDLGAVDAVETAGDALLHLVHAILRMNQHPETLLHRALRKRLAPHPD
ncbi:MAG: MazG nucleotide pyrophosphohydrolase domain-containing protein [Desulfosarcinaceae bacterium]|nr:MazG nucleotide pyrophosphohydrolase domain-containing protein [Desulfosarcinaceae bacterium]